MIPYYKLTCDDQLSVLIMKAYMLIVACLTLALASLNSSNGVDACRNPTTCRRHSHCCEGYMCQAITRIGKTEGHAVGVCITKDEDDDDK